MGNDITIEARPVVLASWQHMSRIGRSITVPAWIWGSLLPRHGSAHCLSCCGVAQRDASSEMSCSKMVILLTVYGYENLEPMQAAGTEPEGAAVI